MNTQELIEDVRRITRLNTRDLTNQRIIEELNLSYFLLLEEIKQLKSDSKITATNGDTDYEEIDILDTNIKQYTKSEKYNNVVKVEFQKENTADWICLKKGQKCGDSICCDNCDTSFFWVDWEREILFSGNIEKGKVRLHFRSGKITQKFSLNNLTFVNSLPPFSHPVLSADVSMKLLPDKKSNLYFIAESQFISFKKALLKHFTAPKKTMSKVKFIKFNKKR